jgi:ferrous iron transport protein A
MSLVSQPQPLTTMPPGLLYTVAEILDDLTACKLMCMGLMPGAQVELVRRMPFGGSCYLRLHGHQVALRYQEAASILVQQPSQHL